MTVVTNVNIFDGASDQLIRGKSVFMADGRITEVSDRPPNPGDGEIIDAAGRTLTPGLIDLHIHAYASSFVAHTLDTSGEAYRTAHAVRMLGFALDCGFTTVRDIGGGDYPLWRAIEDGLLRAPRFLYAGKILSMTGGHGDLRSRDERDHTHGYCSCCEMNTIAVIADGVDACIAATREQLRRGAHCIKIMGSGGVGSPTDPIWMNQYREDEIRAIVNECTERRTYASAHCHPASAVRRCVEFGVRCIEHGTMMDKDTAEFVAERGAYVVPTMSIIFALVEQGRELGFPPESQAKIEIANEFAMNGMRFMREAGVKVGYGTDLLGTFYTQQTREFAIRSEVFRPVEILRQATSMAAEVLQRDDLGRIGPGATADVILVDGDPLQDIHVLAQKGVKVPLVIKDGVVVKRAM